MNKTAKLLNKFEKETGISAKPIKKEYNSLPHTEKEEWRKKIEEKLTKLREWKIQAKEAQFQEVKQEPVVN